MSSNWTGFKGKQTQALWAALGLGGVLVVTQLINSMFGGALFSLGIVPRDFSQVYGILLAPFLHASWWHLLSNLLPLMVMVFFIAQYGQKVLIQALVTIALMSGVMVWFLGSTGVHAGASGVVFGCWGFLLASAYFERSVKSVVIALFVLLLYGGLIFGLLDVRPHISWSSHFFGLIAGVATARLMSPKSK